MKVLCGQCGQMSVTDEPSDGRSVCCTHCGHDVGANTTHDHQPVFEAPPEDEAFAVLVRAGLERKIHVNCGSCGRGLKVSLRMAGRKTTCPACSNRVRLPFAGQEAERLIEELIAQRSPTVMASEPEVPEQAPGDGAPAVMKFAESELAELAKFVETDGSDDTTLDIPEDDDLMHRATEAMEGREILALNEAISAFASLNGAPATEELPALQEAVARSPIQASRGMSTRKRTVLVAVAAAVCIAAGIWVAVGFFSGGGADPDTGDTTALLDPKDNTSNKPDNNTDTTKPPKDPTHRTDPVIPKPIKAIATCRVVTSTTDSFAESGFFPAGPGQLFCRVRVRVTAGDDKLEVDNHGKAALLKIGLESYPSLGEPIKSILPVLPRKRRLRIPAGKSRTIVMLFDLPQKAVRPTGTKGIVALGKIAPVSVELGSVAHVLPALALASSSSPYVEIAPRNTRPVLSDPVMSAIQKTMPQKLSVRPGSNGSMKLALSSGQVTGTARRDTRGLYVTKLAYNGSTLRCLLRFSHGGKEAILYLSEAPFHQLTFARPGWSKTVPTVLHGLDGKPKPVKTPPELVPDKPKHTPPTKRLRGPGFFGL